MLLETPQWREGEDGLPHDQGISKGTNRIPVYFSNGIPVECNHEESLNKTDITGKIGDLLSALNSSGVFQFVFGRKIKDGVVAFGGVWAGLVAIFQALKNQQK